MAAHRLLEETSTITEIVDDPSGWGHKHFHEDLFTFSLVLLGGIARTELAFWHKEQRKFEEAFGGITNAAWDICAATITPITDLHTGESIRNGFEPYLPHSGGPFNIQEVVDIFEEVKKHSRSIDKWDRIESGCAAIRYLGYCDLYSSLDDVTDASGETFVALEYWGKGVTFAQERQLVMGSPYPLDTEDIKQRYSLQDLWNEMDKSTQEILVGAETQWMLGRLDNMVKDLRLMLELVLPSVFPSLEPATRQNDREKRHLTLTIWRDALQKDMEVRARIDELKLSDSNKKKIKKDLPAFLHRVIDARNYFEHGDARKRSYIIEKATDIHDELLGIERDGMLRWLMIIKRDTGAKPKIGS